MASCRHEKPHSEQYITECKTNKLKYAQGFSITDYGTYKIIDISKPWPGAKKTYRYLLSKNDSTIEHLDLTPFDALVKGTIQRAVVTSTTHIPHLELLGVEHTLVGFPGTNYISSKKTRALVNSGQVRELGKNEHLNTEVLLDVNPDLVIGFGVEGVNKTFETIKKTGIPILYNGDWVESTPLAKAEWIKFFGVLYGKEKEADSIFNQIERNYLNAKALARNAKSRPTVMSGAMHKDVWYLPGGSSPEAQLMNDANLNYLWSHTQENGSLALSFEIVYAQAQDADLWLSPSYYTSLEQIKNANSLYTQFKAYERQKVYSFSPTKGDTGGVLYYEMGTARPDLVLKDIIKIGHPELLNNYQPLFFKQLK